jgi:hypothetical protein
VIFWIKTSFNLLGSYQRLRGTAASIFQSHELETIRFRSPEDQSAIKDYIFHIVQKNTWERRVWKSVCKNMTPLKN